jgi:O-antigen ligase/polysaccharide polymerase Wzy-like membrane protein
MAAPAPPERLPSTNSLRPLQSRRRRAHASPGLRLDQTCISSESDVGVPYLAGLILVAYMASVTVHKIWYIATAAVLLIMPFVVRPRPNEFLAYLSDAKWLILYCLAVIASVITSIDPERSQYALLTDAIYPCIFMIFYAVGLRTGYDAIERMMRLLVWAAVIALLFTFDIRIEDRVGHRLISVLPYLTPFVAAAIARGSKLALLELALLVQMVLMTNSRGALGVTALLLGLSLFAFSSSLHHFARRSVVSVLASAAVIGSSLQIEALREITISAVVRLTGMPLGGIQPAIDDQTRQHLSELFWELAPDNGWTGIGYFAFGPIYLSRFYDGNTEMSLHSVFEVWWLETGYLGTAAALPMLMFFFLRTWRFSDDPTVKAGMLGAAGALIAGTVHQMHQAPMLYVMLGLGLGAARHPRSAPSQPQCRILPQEQVWSHRGNPDRRVRKPADAESRRGDIDEPAT